MRAKWREEESGEDRWCGRIKVPASTASLRLWIPHRGGVCVRQTRFIWSKMTKKLICKIWPLLRCCFTPVYSTVQPYCAGHSRRKDFHAWRWVKTQHKLCDDNTVSEQCQLCENEEQKTPKHCWLCWSCCNSLSKKGELWPQVSIHHKDNNNTH